MPIGCHHELFITVRPNITSRQNSMFTKSFSLALIFGVCCCITCTAQSNSETEVPKGFESLFDGKSLDGWYASPTADPRKFAAMSDEQQQEKIAELTEKTGESWRVEDGNIINEGQGPYLTTKREFQDFELLIDFKLEAAGDSGVYLKSSPQVQVWDTTHEAYFKHGSEKGSGGLWNNAKQSPG